jgi:ribosome-associated protein
LPKKQQITSEEKARILLETVEDRKAENPILLDLRDKNVMLADYFLICTGLAVPHIRAISEHVQEKVDELNLARPKVEGEEVAEWVLLDFGDVVLHVMSEEARSRYRLEDFWTTPQPKGALPPTPGTVDPNRSPLERAPAAGDDWEEEDEDDDDDEIAFFADADTEVEPIDEDAEE